MTYLVLVQVLTGSKNQPNKKGGGEVTETQGSPPSDVADVRALCPPNTLTEPISSLSTRGGTLVHVKPDFIFEVNSKRNKRLETAKSMIKRTI